MTPDEAIVPLDPAHRIPVRMAPADLSLRGWWRDGRMMLGAWLRRLAAAVEPYPIMVTIRIQALDAEAVKQAFRSWRPEIRPDDPPGPLCIIGEGA